MFLKGGDYAAFLKALGHAGEQVPMRVLAFCLMPNHFHLAVWPVGDGDLSRWMHWLLNAHVRRYHRHYGGSGHLWQGRFKAFPVEHDDHLLTMLRYIERNPVRAGLVERAEEWPWSSRGAAGRAAVRLDPGPVARGPGWAEWVNRPLTDAELASLRLCAARGRPYGSAGWAVATAEQLGLEASLRPRGRPRKAEKR